jgi:hypothetical protein
MPYSTARVRTALLLATASVAATACSESPASSLEPGTPALATRSDQSNVREPFSITADNPCTPAVEAILLEGTIHGLGSTWDNGHFKSHYNVKLTGVDANGVEYQATSTGNGNGEFPGSPTEDVIISTVISGQGGVPNFVMKIVLHFAADGTVQVDKSSEECRG